MIDFYDLARFLHRGALYCSVHKTHYGLPQSGALSQQRLFKHLAAHGYHQLPHTPSFFRNETGNVRFGLVVDDFAVLWTNRTALNHLLTTLTQLYQIKVNYEGTKYLGMTIAIDRVARHVTLTMPGYIDKLLRKTKPEGIKGASTPATYTPPNYKSAGAQRATTDTSPYVSDSEKKYLQSVIGTLLYYSQAVEPTMCTAIHELGSIQAAPTQNDMAKLDRLLQYAAAHKNNGIRYYASDMTYRMMSDASYLCIPRARSAYGLLGYLGADEWINGPIYCAAKMISCVVASAAEAELAGGFQAAQIGVQHRNTLQDLGYPQPATSLRMDNTVALGIAEGKTNGKRSKSMDMRFFWLADRVSQKHFRTHHVPGQWNIADFFRKPLPRHKFRQFAHYLAINMDEHANHRQTPSYAATTTVTMRQQPSVNMNTDDSNTSSSA